MNIHARMRNKIVGALSGALLALVIVQTPMMAYGESAEAGQSTTDVEHFNTAAESALLEQLEALAEERDLEAEFGDVSISVLEDLVKEYAGDAEAYASDILGAYEGEIPDDTAYASTDSTMTPFGTATYTSAVFAGVPAGGVCWIHQDFRATVTNYQVTWKSLLGSSYQTGVCVFQWSPNYSYFSGSLNVHSKGTFHAVVKGGPVSFSATFKAIYQVNQSSLKQNVQ
jgi:hypothetical protein